MKDVGRKAIGRGLVVLCGAATCLVIGVLGLILADLVRHGTGRLTWELVSSGPRGGVTGGGIFPVLTLVQHLMPGLRRLYRQSQVCAVRQKITQPINRSFITRWQIRAGPDGEPNRGSEPI